MVLGMNLLSGIFEYEREKEGERERRPKKSAQRET
jgi:hypothetical protein